MILQKLVNNKFIISLIISIQLNSCITKTKVDLIVHNANIYTINSNNDIYESVAVKDGEIIDLGKNNQILNKYKADQTLDIAGKYIYPGFIDAHCHFLNYGLQQEMVNLSSANSLKEIITLLKNHYSQNKEQWLVGYGWDQNKWDNKTWPNNSLLNENFKNTNVVIRRIDGHALIANEKAIYSSKINLDTIIDKGHIEIINNKPTGIFIDNAMNLILSKIPKPNEISKKTALLKSQKECFSFGLTTVDIAGLNKSDIELIDRLQSTEELKIKVYAMLSDNEENLSYYLDTIGTPIKKNRLNIRSFKFFADGSLGSRGACMIKPYKDKITTNGFMLQKINIYEEKLDRLKKNGFQACTHAIGDSANRTILNSYSKVLKESNDLRWRIEHAQCVSTDDINKFRQYNIIPSVQPTHATSDFSWAILRLGKKRLIECYQYYSLFKQNQLIALGTDFPVEEINPINTFYAAVFRKNSSGKPIEGFQKDQALTRLEAIKGMTIWAALSNFEENEKGSLEIGKSADLVVLNKDLFTERESEILKTKVLKTIVNGEIVYSY